MEHRRLLAVNLTVDFRPDAAATAKGSTFVDRGSRFAEQNGLSYGWNRDNSTHFGASDAGVTPTDAHDGFAYMQGKFGSRTWHLALPDGVYRVSVTAGDASAGDDVDIRVGRHSVVKGRTTADARWLSGGRTVTVTDGMLTLKSADAAGANPINFLTVKAVTPRPPALVDGDDESAAPPVASEPSTNVRWPGTAQWKLAANAPAARFESHGISYNGKLYVFGGWADRNFNSTRRVDVYDPVANTWTRRADMKAPETHAGAALDEANGVVYFVAGHRGSLKGYTPTDEVWKYTIKTDTWTKLNVKTPYKFGGQATQIVGNTLYAFGGNAADRYTAVRDVLALDLTNVDAGFKKVNSFPLSRDHLSSVVVGTSIYAIGGEFGHDVDHDQQKIVQRYDTTTNTWARVADLPGVRSHAESSTFVLSGKIIVAGGQITPQASTREAYEYDPATNTWRTIAGLPARRQGTIVAPVGDAMVFTTGGIETWQPQTTTYTLRYA